MSFYVEIAIVHYDEPEAIADIGKSAGLEFKTHCSDGDNSLGLFDTHIFKGTVENDGVIELLLAIYLGYTLERPYNSMMFIESSGESKFDMMWTQCPDCVS